MSDKCYICGEETGPPEDMPTGLCEPVPVDFINGGVTICANCEGRIERKGHKGFRIPDGNRVRRAFSDKQADAFFARELPGIRCVYDYSEELCS